MTVLAKEIEATYEVLSKMGEGGMGAVYKVRHRFFDEIRVIKVMQARLEPDDAQKERFLGEAKRGKQLRHPNLAEVLDFSIAADGTAYIVMEYIEGVNLRELMTRNGGPLDPQTVVAVAEQTLDALAFMHSKKLVHRDISPENLMLTTMPDGQSRVKLIDLGIAKSLESKQNLTMIGTFVGKVQYASPEQFGGRLDPRSDIYSLGVVLYELLTGVKPIAGTDPMAIVRGHLTLPPRSFEETDPEHRVPTALRNVVMTALNKRADDRFQTDAEFAEALRASLERDDRPTLPGVTAPANAFAPIATEVDAQANTVADLPKTVVTAPPRRSFAIVAVAALLLVIAMAALLWQRRPPAVVTPPASIATVAAETSVTVDARPPAAALQTGRLLINALPWGEVTSVVDTAGEEQLTDGRADTPLVMSLLPGDYRVTLTNPNSKRSVVLDATVQANALAKCETALDSIDAAAYVARIDLDE